MGRVGAADAVEVGLGGGGLAAHAPVDHGDLNQDPHLVAGLERAAAELILVERRQFIPLFAGGVRLGEVVEGVGLAGGERQHLLLGGDGAGGRAELAGGGGGQAEPGRDAIVLVLGLGEDERLDPRHALPVAGGAVGDLGERGGAAVSLVDGERLLDVLERVEQGVGAAVTVGDVGGAGVERALERALARGGLREVALHQVAPLGALGLVVLERLLGGRIVLADLGEPRVRGARLVRVDQLVLVDARQLGLHRPLHGAPAGERDLQLEQPRHRGPLAPLLVAPTRHPEQPLHLGVGHAGIRCGHRLRQIVPGRFVLGIVLQPPEGNPNCLDAHHHPGHPRVIRGVPLSADGRV